MKYTLIYMGVFGMLFLLGAIPAANAIYYCTDIGIDETTMKAYDFKTRKYESAEEVCRRACDRHNLKFSDGREGLRWGHYGTKSQKRCKKYYPENTNGTYCHCK